MITGDTKETAEAIGKEINIITEEEIASGSFTGSELEEMQESELKEIFRNCINGKGGLIISRAEPKQKRIVVQHLSALVKQKLTKLMIG